jgi:uncharacterized protein (TIGR04222 family)
VNPFNLAGTGFLVFYWALSVLCLLFVYWQRLRSDVGGLPAQMPTDPYLLAYLRAGYPEVVRVALLTLVEEGIVTVDGRTLSLAPEAARARFQPKRKLVERELLEFLARTSATIDQIVANRVGRVTCGGYRLTLNDLGLVPRVDLHLTMLAVGTLLVSVAFIKMVVALSRERTNVAFLLMSAMAAVWLTMRLGRLKAGTTTRGRQVLDSAEALLVRARQRLNEAGAALRGPELAWLAAVFGFYIFERAPAEFTFWPALAFAPGSRHRSPEERKTAGSGSSWWSSCGTSVSSCGGGGGASCGGGGGCGGGGCGGCGGE